MKHGKGRNNVTVIDEQTGEITALGYDTTQLQDFGDFVSAGLEELQKRDRSTWALGDIAAALEIREGRPSDRDETIPTVADLAREWGETRSRVSRWRSNALFWPTDYRAHVHGSERDKNNIREYLEWEQHGQDYETKFERALEILEEVKALTLRGASLEMWLKDKRRDIQNSYPLPPGKYQVIYADPPWEYGNTMPEEFGEQKDHYQTMTVSEIAAMPIAGLAHDNAVLFLWVTSPILEEAFEVVKAWGFEYKSSFVWNKDAHVMGHYNSVRHEFLFVCVRGSYMPVEPNQFGSVVTIKRTKEHSEKPAQFRKMIERMYPESARVELFARERVDGWVVYGNELEPA